MLGGPGSGAGVRSGSKGSAGEGAEVQDGVGDAEEGGGGAEGGRDERKARAEARELSMSGSAWLLRSWAAWGKAVAVVGEGAVEEVAGGEGAVGGGETDKRRGGGDLLALRALVEFVVDEVGVWRGSFRPFDILPAFTGDESVACFFLGGGGLWGGRCFLPGALSRGDLRGRGSDDDGGGAV
jgi:hypothetical protein